MIERQAKLLVCTQAEYDQLMVSETGRFKIMVQDVIVKDGHLAKFRAMCLSTLQIANHEIPPEHTFYQELYNKAKEEEQR